jgi:hypothetical protein
MPSALASYIYWPVCKLPATCTELSFAKDFGTGGRLAAVKVSWWDRTYSTGHVSWNAFLLTLLARRHDTGCCPLRRRALSWPAEELGFHSQQEQKIFLVSRAFIPLGTSTNLLYRSVMQPNPEADRLPPSSAEARNSWSYTSISPYVCIYRSQCHVITSAPSHPPWLDHSNYTWRRGQIMKLLIKQFLQPPVTSFLLGPNNLLSTLFLNNLSLCSTLKITDQISYP